MGMEIEPLKQPNDATCWHTVAAMIAGCTVQEVIDFIGHDGYVMKDGARVKQGTWDDEAILFLLSKGWTIGAWFDGMPDERGSVLKDFGCYSTLPAVLVVKSQRFEGLTHVVLWDGEKVFDPNPEKPETCSLKGYEVRQWWPLIRRGNAIFQHMTYQPPLVGVAAS